MKRLIAILATLLPVALYAHPGHGTGNGMDLAHHLTSPLHFMPLVCVIGIIVYWYKRTHPTTDN